MNLFMKFFRGPQNPAIGFIVLLLTSCGANHVNKIGKQDQYSYDGIGDESGQYDIKQSEVHFPLKGTPPKEIQEWGPELTQPEREKYCAIFTPQEDSPIFQRRFLNALTGKWKRTIKSKNGDSPFASIFTFSNEQKMATLSEARLEPREEILFKRVCISEELYPDNAYYGFRIAELAVDSNESVVVFGVKFETPAFGHKYPTLWMTERKVLRYGSVDRVRTEDWVFSAISEKEASAPIWIYPFRD